MDIKYILLWFEAPLQSWGADSKFGRRDTLPFPTRSGVLGLLLCALGASGEQKELLARMASFKQTVISYAPLQKKGNTRKKERDPVLMDFHMVGSGYDEKNFWENFLIPKTSDGKKAVGGGTKMTFRYYLQNAKFAVIIEAPQSDSESFASALQNPIYDVYLGRKNCAPTEFIFQGVFDTPDGAFNKAGQLMQEKNLVEDFRVLDGEYEGNVMTLNDVPLQFGVWKKYRDRRVTVVDHE